jgi:hypothetical protein
VTGPRRRWPGGLVVVIALLPYPAGAQIAPGVTDCPPEPGPARQSALEQAPQEAEAPLMSVRSQAEPGARLRVVDWSGRSQTGELVEVLASAVRLRSASVAREVPLTDIAVIRRNGDSIWNGVLWGTIVGGAVSRGHASYGLVLAGIGAGVGAVVDVMVRDDEVLYQAPEAASLVELGKDRWVAAPEVKVSRVNDRFAAVVGGYGGRLIANTFLIGAAGYWLASGDDRVKMRYGGVVIASRPRTDRRLAFGARALFGVGTHESWISHPAGAVHTRHGLGFYAVSGLVVAEPQLDLVWTGSDWFQFYGGIGYRLIGAAEEDRLGGFNASLGVRFSDGFRTQASRD